MSYNRTLIVEGDPEGVFLELFFKSLKSKSYKNYLILICSKDNLEKQMNINRLKKKINLLNIKKINQITLKKNEINLIDIKLEKKTNKDLKKKYIKDYIEKCFEISFELIRKGFANKLINGPVDKKIFLNNKFLGVTEYISSKFNKKKTGMLIYNKKLSVCPVTTHLPLKNVVKSIDKNIIKEKIKLVNEFYLKYLKLKPRIAVTGLNPHCESILRFNEDENILKPAIKDMKKKNINVKGPFPADTIFSSKNRNIYDVVIGMYHDQVLSPIKALYEFDAINVTMGLPFLRATPDHGPNKEMVGKNLSNPTSLIKALEFLDKK
ncbi:4-hydroxythreonine-4-phosphate dehydrogenase PdxA [Candidatus Pelagibacter sp. HIMB1321]|uniref:4-hydroxythreonine-4-phosphate dehydrogenase PdxA n=1 Tax=Candidatus Pelagibacter sp. HIMB1321 TaxID=1388755 RepID=UPI000A07E320|nr:4-hydroxythreonine-4-phosphate dehydrogenase PdxA [Candidatus Pelagibacter sp. HIMB1321]SMF72385.1 4-hydroxythreonine-4-phosphate dehydrogenase [Candidatus Pelagibacter sp. HIMB1321]